MIEPEAYELRPRERHIGGVEGCRRTDKVDAHTPSATRVFDRRAAPPDLVGHHCAWQCRTGQIPVARPRAATGRVVQVKLPRRQMKEPMLTGLAGKDAVPR